MDLPATIVNNCNNACPVCNGKITEMIMPVKRIGLSKFLADTFINNPTGALTPAMLIKKLSTYPSVGQVVYNRTRSDKCPPSKFMSATVLQLIDSGLVRMDIDKDINCVLRLVINDLAPSYLDNSIWSNLYTVNEVIEDSGDLKVSINND